MFGHGHKFELTRRLIDGRAENPVKMLREIIQFSISSQFLFVCPADPGGKSGKVTSHFMCDLFLVA